MISLFKSLLNTASIESNLLTESRHVGLNDFFFSTTALSH